MNLAQWLKTTPPIGLYLEQGYGVREWYTTLYRIGALPNLTPDIIDFEAKRVGLCLGHNTLNCPWCQSTHAGPWCLIHDAVRQGSALTLLYRSSYTPSVRDVLNYLRMDTLEEEHQVNELDHVQFRKMLGTQHWHELVYSVDI